MNSLVKIAVTLAFIAPSTGKLPNIIKEVRIAQLKLLKESQATKCQRLGCLKAIFGSAITQDLYHSAVAVAVAAVAAVVDR